MKDSLLAIQEAGNLTGEASLLAADAVRDDPAFALARQTREVWEGLTDGGLPSRSQIDPLSFGPKLLPHLVILDVLDAPGGTGPDFRWRLFGTRHEAEYGADLTGLLVSDLAQENSTAEAFRAILIHCYDSREPTFFRLTYLNKGEIDRRCTGVMLPVLDRDGRYAYMLGCADWT